MILIHKKLPVFLFTFWPCGMWDLSSQIGIEPMPPVLKAWSLNHWTTREFPVVHILFLSCFIYGCSWAFSSCCKRGYCLIVEHGLLIVVASLVAEHRLRVLGLQ